MIPVVVVGGDHRADGGKGLCPDAALLQQRAVIGGKGGDLHHAVVHHAHIHAGLRLLLEHLKDAAPHVPFFNDEKFHEDEFFRLLQFLQQGGEHLVAQGEIDRLGLIVHRETAAPVQVFHQVVRTRAVRLQFFPHPFRLLQRVPGLRDQLAHAPADLPVADVGFREGQKGRAGDRHDGDDEHPGQLCR